MDKESACNPEDGFGSRRPMFDLWGGKIPWRRAWQPTPVFSPGASHGQRSLAGYSPWGRKESDTAEATEHAHTLEKYVLTVCSPKPGELPVFGKSAYELLWSPCFLCLHSTGTMSLVPEFQHSPAPLWRHWGGGPPLFSPLGSPPKTMAAGGAVRRVVSRLSSSEGKQGDLDPKWNWSPLRWGSQGGDPSVGETGFLRTALQ